jgi:hypothetical protein
LDRSNGLLTVDRLRIERVLKRIVRGLFFHRCAMRLPDEYAVSLWSDWFGQGTKDGPDFNSSLQQVERSFSLQPPTRIGNGVFEFRSLIRDSDPYLSAWHLLFYAHRSFIGITAPAKT